MRARCHPCRSAIDRRHVSSGTAAAQVNSTVVPQVLRSVHEPCSHVATKARRASWSVATQCRTLQRSDTYCNIVAHVATLCRTLQLSTPCFNGERRANLFRACAMLGAGASECRRAGGTKARPGIRCVLTNAITPLWLCSRVLETSIRPQGPFWIQYSGSTSSRRNRSHRPPARCAATAIYRQFFELFEWAAPFGTIGLLGTLGPSPAHDRIAKALENRR